MNRRRLGCAGVFALASTFAPLVHAQSSALPPVVVQGEPACPSVAAIRAALAASRPDGEWPEQTVIVEVANEQLFLTLGGAGAATSVRRTIPADRDCRVRAESVAVIVAAWSGELLSHPTDSAVLPMAFPTAAPVLAPSPGFGDAPAATLARPAPVRAAAPRASHVLDLDGGAFYSLTWGHAPGAWLSLGRIKARSGLGLRAFGAYQSARDITLEGGTNQIMRLLGGVTATYQDQWRALFTSGDLGLVGTLTRAEGSGYATDRSASNTNLGAVADLRGGLALGRVRLFASVRLLGLARSEAVKIQSTSPGIADTARFSRWDAQIGVGLGFRFEPM